MSPCSWQLVSLCSLWGPEGVRLAWGHNDGWDEEEEGLPVSLWLGSSLVPTLQQGGEPCWGSRGYAFISPALSSTPFSSPTMNHAFPCTNPSTLPCGSQPMSPRTTMGRRRQRQREHKSSCKPWSLPSPLGCVYAQRWERCAKGWGVFWPGVCWGGH